MGLALLAIVAAAGAGGLIVAALASELTPSNASSPPGGVFSFDPPQPPDAAPAIKPVPPGSIL